MNTIFALAFLAVALIAGCEALGNKDSYNRCTDEARLNASEIAYLKANKVDGPTANLKSFAWCYYTNLNLVARFNDASEKLSRAAFVANYPTKVLNGAGLVEKCNQGLGPLTGVVISEDRTWALHKCLVQSGFTL